MDRYDLYEELSKRKSNPDHLKPYNGGNGRIDRFLDLLRCGQLPKGGMVVDLGGSHGDLVELGVREGLFDAGHVLDISKQAVSTAWLRGLRASFCDIDCDSMPVGDSTASAVTALDVIEHLVDPEHFAREAYRVLRPGGFVFVNTPNIQFWRNMESLVVNGVFPHTSGDREVYHGGHLAFFTVDDMERIFTAAGFSLFKVHPDENYEVCPPIWRQLYRGPEPTPRLCNPNILFSARKP